MLYKYLSFSSHVLDLHRAVNGTIGFYSLGVSELSLLTTALGVNLESKVSLLS